MSGMQEAVERPISGVTPFLAIRDGRGAEALELYERAFGAKIIERNMAKDGKRLMQASMKINGGWVMLSDEFPENGFAAEPPASVTLHLQVDDADKWFNRAVEEGCKVKMTIADQFWGDRYGAFTDPFGHTWSVGSPLKKATS